MISLVIPAVTAKALFYVDYENSGWTMEILGTDHGNVDHFRNRPWLEWATGSTNLDKSMWHVWWFLISMGGSIKSETWHYYVAFNIRKNWQSCQSTGNKQKFLTCKISSFGFGQALGKFHGRTLMYSMAVNVSVIAWARTWNDSDKPELKDVILSMENIHFNSRLDSPVTWIIANRHVAERKRQQNGFCQRLHRPGFQSR